MSKTKILISVFLLIIVVFVAFKFIKYRSKEGVIPPTKDYTNVFFIVYQAKRLGVTTQNTCSFAPYGGIQREINKVNSLRSMYSELLYLDAGNSLAPIPKEESNKNIKSQQQTNTEAALYIAKKLVEAKIDAIGVGETDMNLGLSSLKKIEQETSIPFISSNIKYKNNNEYPFKRYILKTVKNIKFAIISLVNPTSINDNSVEVLDPKQVINELVPSLKKDSDFIVLLSQIPVDTISSIVSESEEASNIKVIVSADVDVSTEKIFWINQGKTIIANQFTKGYYLGELEINYQKPFVAFSSAKELRTNLSKLKQFQRILEAPDTTQKLRDSVLKSINRINTTLQITEIPGATTYAGSVAGLDESYDN